jgi:hypothetical protein
MPPSNRQSAMPTPASPSRLADAVELLRIHGDADVEVGELEGEGDRVGGEDGQPLDRAVEVGFPWHSLWPQDGGWARACREERKKDEL